MHFYLVWAWLLYLLFVIYGSLVPLNFAPRPIDEAITAFRNMPYLQLGIGSRADWVANILLFIPLSFLTLLIWVRNASVVVRLVASLGTWLFCVVLCVAIEFVQLFFPPRTVSLNDIVAESLGGFAGVSLWWLFGRRFAAWLEGWLSGADKHGLTSHGLQVYVGAVLVYSLMPLDLSLSPAEIYRKWADGRVVLIPFGFSYANLTEMVYGRATDLAIWVPVALLLVLNRWPVRTAWLITVALAAGVEFLQLFVYSRVTDVTQIILAAGGACCGVKIAAQFHVRSGSAIQIQTVPTSAVFVFSRLVFWGLLFLVWSLILAAVFWYPYDFNLQRDFVILRAKGLLASVPFQAYYYGSEYRALTEVIHKTVFFIPCGVVSALLCANVPLLRQRSVLSFLIALALIAGTAAFIDAGRFLIATKGIDIADGFLQVAGGLMGYWGTRRARLMADP